ncbi:MULTISPECIES: hypothetical protein [unclassified Pseudomonas]|uniref:hypothetical protein n=1 Tax=unclassified Pseudomonas TaxID=196821 RepID=UPI00244A3576|nr:MULTISPECIES: hypothetical protein [unclassified Pseudomonas]MDH0303684.1 hypothetical protein [Pseudomonas sp. GD04091]MDH1986698.1 hypothetical protein [Pseudomonas sp. GD03689]
MKARHALLIPLSLACAQALASYQPPGGTDEQYREAVTTLDALEPRLLELVQRSLAGTPAQALAADAAALRKERDPALVQLQQAAAQGHAVAQYRLALYYFAYEPSVDVATTCKLMTDSLEQGFAPAALRVSTDCIGYVDGPAYLPALQKALADFPQFASYYPQPAVWFECFKPDPKDNRLQWGEATAYKAELYRLLGHKAGRRDSPMRREYWQQAVDLNGCPRIADRMSTAQANVH